MTLDEAYNSGKRFTLDHPNFTNWYYQKIDDTVCVLRYNRRSRISDLEHDIKYYYPDSNNWIIHPEDEFHDQLEELVK